MMPSNSDKSLQVDEYRGTSEIMYTTKLVFIIVNCAMLQRARAQRYNCFVHKPPLWGWKEELKVWPNKIPNKPRFWDRISLIIINIPNYLNSSSEKTVLVPSVLIDRSRLLTAYNPFRDIIRNPRVVDKLVVAMPQYYDIKTHFVRLHISEIVCGRQIVYMPDDEVEHWHGVDRKHSPVHDLMVLRADEEFLRTAFTNHLGYEARFEQSSFGFRGPVMTFLADVREKLGNSLTIYSLGYRTKKEMKNYNKIHPLTIEPTDEELVNCEEWMPRQWGYFICLRNQHKYPGLGAGAMLYSNFKLFGVGSFVLFRNKTSILVFTDIRPYTKLLRRTCTDEEFTHKW